MPLPGIDPGKSIWVVGDADPYKEKTGRLCISPGDAVQVIRNRQAVNLPAFSVITAEVLSPDIFFAFSIAKNAKIR